MTKQEAQRVLNAAPGNDKVAQLLALDMGVMVDVLMVLNPSLGMVGIAKWFVKVTS